MCVCVCVHMCVCVCVCVHVCARVRERETLSRILGSPSLFSENRIEAHRSVCKYVVLFSFYFLIFWGNRGLNRILENRRK